uniref:Uncharacterized protein n=1 Tax=Anguilla anguilla TaxID=7936 RepID=A0A0E9VHP6_ANGAN
MKRLVFYVRLYFQFTIKLAKRRSVTRNKETIWLSAAGQARLWKLSWLWLRDC